MVHDNLSMEFDKNLIEKVLDDIDNRYIILFLYIIRNDLFKDLSDTALIEAYERVLILDEIFKNNITTFWEVEFTEIAIDLGLFKNIRSLRDFEQKDKDFVIKLGEETITIEGNTISVPDDTLFLMISKKFKFLTRRNFNLALTKLKGVMCEKENLIHPFIFEIGDHDYTLSDDLFFILEQFGNIYQAIKIEITIEGFYQRFSEIQDKIKDFIDIFDSKLNTKPIQNKIVKAIEEDKEIFQYLKDDGAILSDKFDFDKLDKTEEAFASWYSTLNLILNLQNQIKIIDDQLNELKKIYAGKDKKYTYLEFIEKVSFNEDNIIDNIQKKLLDMRHELVQINEKLSEFNKKELKILNLDYEKYHIMKSDEE